MNNKGPLIKNYLLDLLSRQLSKETMLALEKIYHNASSPDEELFTYQYFARIPSLTGKAKINFSNELLQKASAIRNGWRPDEWRLDQTARILLLLSLPSQNGNEYKARLKKFFETADMNELETLCLGLPLFPFGEDLVDLAQFGFRSNMKNVFEAVALNNPYPADHFDLPAWNQMVLKALFVGSPVYKIYGVDERANENLAGMLCDYAHERWAAGRFVNPELWRSVGPFIDEKKFMDVQKVFSSEEPLQREAAALACAVSKHPASQQLLNTDAELKEKIINKKINWNILAEQWYKN